MNFAVTADGKSLDSQVSEKFEQCLYLLIVNMNDLTLIVLKTEGLSGTSPDDALARKVLEYNCESVITGNINQLAFEILADAQITRYFGFGHSVKDALELSEKQSLQLIKEECSSDHHR